MTKETFNSLPLAARNFIQANAGCLSCGNSEAKLTRAYALYLNSEKMNTYTLFGGAVNFSQEGERGILRGIKPEDTPGEIREKLRIAKAIHAVSPHLFMAYDEKAMTSLAESLPAEEVVDLDFNVAKASYDQLRAFVADNGIATKGNPSKKDLIKAIEALATEEGNELL